MTYSFGNAQSIGQRQTQEDAFGFSDPGDAAFVAHAGFLAVLADGMGGLAHGDLAGRSAIRAFLDAYSQKTPAETIPDALARALVAANLAVLAAAVQIGQADHLGTTLVAAILLGNEAYWISIGDSALFHLRGGEVTQYNRPHVYSIDLDARVLAGELAADHALADPQREALTSYLGMSTPPLVDGNLRPMRIADTDILLLASDGLFKTLPPAQFPPCSGTLQDHCERLVAAALDVQAPSQDNITVIGLCRQLAPPVIETPPVIAPPKRPWLSWVAIVVFIAAAAGAIFWIAQREAANHPTQKVETPKNQRDSNGPRFDTSKLPGPHEAAKE